MSKDKEESQQRIYTLQQEITALRQEISEQPRVDELHRKNFTKLLGKPEDNILSWAEVYFELGYLKGKAWTKWQQEMADQPCNDDMPGFEGTREALNNLPNFRVK